MTNDREIFLRREPTMTKSAVFTFISAIGLSISLTACPNDADVASHNLSQAADNFEIPRRIVFYNGITNDYMLTIEGLCSQAQEPKKLAVTCKVGDNQYKKHFLGLSDNVTYFSEQMEPAKVSKYFYRITFKPSTIVPSINLQ
jgi:hypothetical protein